MQHVRAIVPAVVDNFCNRIDGEEAPLLSARQMARRLNVPFEDLISDRGIPHVVRDGQVMFDEDEVLDAIRERLDEIVFSAETGEEVL